MFSYAVVESALADVFDVEAPGRAALRSRIRNLQRLGLRPASPGSGKRTLYSFSDLCDLTLALTLAEFGTDPKKIVTQVEPGSTAKQPKGRFCVFIPKNFSQGGSDLMFINEASVTKMAVHGSSLAVINIDWLLFRVGAHTTGREIKRDDS